MKNFRVLILFSVLSLIISNAIAQSAADGKQIKNAISINPLQYLVNEINLGYEHFISENKSIEVNGGIIYRNEFWLNAAKDWVNSQYFREQGFAARVYYKAYKKTNEKNNNKSFYAFGLNYQYLYFNNEWIETGKQISLPDDAGGMVTVKEEMLMHRFRHRIGAQLLLGNVIPAGNHFALEFYYGLGIRGIYADRFDVARGGTIDGEKVIQTYLNYEETHFYLRPTIHAGIKLKLGW